MLLGGLPPPSPPPPWLNPFPSAWNALHDLLWQVQARPCLQAPQQSHRPPSLPGALTGRRWWQPESPERSPIRAWLSPSNLRRRVPSSSVGVSRISPVYHRHPFPHPSSTSGTQSSLILPLKSTHFSQHKRVLRGHVHRDIARRAGVICHPS